MHCNFHNIQYFLTWISSFYEPINNQEMSEENWGYQLLHSALIIEPHFYNNIKELRQMKSLCWEGRLSPAGTRDGTSVLSQHTCRGPCVYSSIFCRGLSICFPRGQCCASQLEEWTPQWIFWCEQKQQCWSMTGPIPLKMLYACNTSFCRVEEKTSNRKHFKKRNVLVFSTYISEQGFTL